jgi:hypothetical protein
VHAGQRVRWSAPFFKKIINWCINVRAACCSLPEAELPGFKRYKTLMTKPNTFRLAVLALKRLVAAHAGSPAGRFRLELVHKMNERLREEPGVNVFENVQ